VGPYLKVIREKCSQALHILDRCHIVAKMNTALDEVRAGESRRMANEGRSPLLKKSRWLLLKREETQDRTALPSRNAGFAPGSVSRSLPCGFMRMINTQHAESSLQAHLV
jgi:transposase